MKEKKIGNFDVVEVPGDEGGATILMLHGYGADAHDLVGLSSISQKKPKPRWIFPNGPLPIAFGGGFFGRAWFPIEMDLLQSGAFKKAEERFLPDLEKGRKALENLILDLNISPDKLLIGGFSQGAILALDTLLHSPFKFAMVILFSAVMLSDDTWQKLAPLHAKTPFFQSHGKQDPLLPFSLAERLEEFLLQHHFKGKLSSFEGGHEIPQKILLEFQGCLERALS